MPAKMLSPNLMTRMEQLHDDPCFRVNPGQVWAFMVIAGKTGECEIVERCWPMMLQGNDVIDFKRTRIEPLWHLTIFAQIASPLPNRIAQQSIHQEISGVNFRKEIRALDCNNPRRLPIFS